MEARRAYDAMEARRAYDAMEARRAYDAAATGALPGHSISAAYGVPKISGLGQNMVPTQAQREAFAAAYGAQDLSHFLTSELTYQSSYQGKSDDWMWTKGGCGRSLQQVGIPHLARLGVEVG